MKLSDWARQQGISYITAWRWFWAGKLPVPARQLPTGTILVEAPCPEGITVLYARVSSADQRDVLEILTSACGRLYGRRSAKRRAQQALEAMGCK